MLPLLLLLIEGMVRASIDRTCVSGCCASFRVLTSYDRVLVADDIASMPSDRVLMVDDTASRSLLMVLRH